MQGKQRDYLQNYKSLWVPALICGFCMQNNDFWIRNTSLYGSQTSPVHLRMHNCVLRSRMTLAYWSQPPSVVLCIRNSDFSIRITSLYGSQPSFVVFACKTTTLGPELQVSMGPRPHVFFFCIQNSDFSTRIASLYGSKPSSVGLRIHNS